MDPLITKDVAFGVFSGWGSLFCKAQLAGLFTDGTAAKQREVSEQVAVESSGRSEDWD